jgi:hypothetical protein
MEEMMIVLHITHKVYKKQTKINLGAHINRPKKDCQILINKKMRNASQTPD